MVLGTEKIRKGNGKAEGDVWWAVVDVMLRQDVCTRKRDLGIINISMVLVVMTVNEITPKECEK